ncbi:uncharacterized protein LOC125238216 [Leguminivora glycinivorella]|uniref:uncharacterized protein LOC125238216 n=1 Tax=Leguminivora glycinivorella TaxID=1035111 RepID=UPI00200C0AE0|nr:uncharacterized protein LOC125238216 [Leguminivora glycinivorella]
MGADAARPPSPPSGPAGVTEGLSVAGAQPMGAATANSTLRYGLTVETPRSPSYDTTLLWRRDLAKRLRRRSRPTPIPARHPKAAVIDRTTEKRKSLQETTKEVNKPIIKAQSVRSHASSRTVIEAQLSQAELEASERLAEISRRELQLEADMVRKRLDARKLQIRANADSADEHESAGSVRNSNQDRLDEWLENSRDATSKPIFMDIDRRHYADNPMLIREVTDRLSPHLRSRWCDYAKKHRDSKDPEILQLADFLMEESEQEMSFYRATRCQPAQSVRIEDEWYEGPRFLYGPETSWPSHTSNRTDDLPERKARPSTETSLAIISAKPDPSSVLPDVRRFSSYDRLLNATANVLLFIEKMRTKNKALQLQVRHLRKAEHMWLQYSQRRSFPEELRALSQNRLIDRKSRLYDLAPELGDDGVLRMKTRLGSAPVLYTALQPIILDGREPFTRLLILRAHRRSAHIHNEAVINELRQEYWILHLRPTVKSVARNCALCTLRRATPRAQPLGDLPPERLQAYQRPFTHTAQDYMGPMFVTIGRRREKRWVCLYTCLVTRAIHLESVHSLSTDSALLSLRRFAARRGWPRTMYSDNATCFRAAATELREAYRQWLPVLQTYATQNRMEWKFIPPGNPSAGGAWERMIRTVKIAMSYTFNERAPKPEVFETLLAEIENIVNRRPLTHVNVDPDSEESLTPAHFLLLHNANLPMIGVYDENEKKQWKMAQALADHFWRRWTKEYFPLLAPRKSSHDGGRQLQPGDVVIVAEPNGPRSVWPRGVVETTYPGPDGRVRSADIRTRHGTLRRPSCRLAVIASQPMHQESSTAGTKC